MNSGRPARIRVLGLGNAMRGDDGAGPAVIAALRARGFEQRAELQNLRSADGLIDRLGDVDAALLIDAAAGDGRAAGRIHRFEGEEALSLPAELALSSHGLGLAQALGFAHAMGRLPPSLKLYAVEGRDFAAGAGLSAPVRRAVRVLTERIAKDLMDGALI